METDGEDSIKLLQAEIEGMASLLLDVQRDCVNANLQVTELLEALEDITNQHCRVSYRDGMNVYDEKGYHLDSMALSANAHAMQILAKHGRLKVTRSYGRRMIGKWIDET